MKSERAENYIILGSIILAAALVALIFLPELDAIVLGITFAVLFWPLYRRLVEAFHHERTLAALLVVLITILIVLAPLTYIGVQMFGEATSLYQRVTSGGGLAVLQHLNKQFIAAHPSIGATLTTYLQQFLGWMASHIALLFPGLANALFALVLSFFALYYFLRDGSRLREAVLVRVPVPRERTEHFLVRLHEIVNAIVRGTLLMSVFYGIAGGLGFLMVGLPNGVFWGVVIAFAAFIPVFGTSLVIIPAMIVLMVEHHWIAAFGLLLWMAVVGTVYENYLRPWFIGRQAHIHPLLILFSIVGGLSVFGPLGILLGPLALGVLLALLDIYPLLSGVQEPPAKRARSRSHSATPSTSSAASTK